MPETSEETHEGPATGVNPAGAVGLGLLAVVVVGAVAFGVLRRPAAPPPAAVARDPMLAAGRLVFLDRCVSCHGASGKGNGPIAKGLAGPPVGDLTDATWKHGDRPEQVLAVLDKGVTGAAMPGWGRTLSAGELRAVAAYVYYLAGRQVPATLRDPRNVPAAATPVSPGAPSRRTAGDRVGAIRSVPSRFGRAVRIVGTGVAGTGVGAGGEILGAGGRFSVIIR